MDETKFSPHYHAAKFGRKWGIVFRLGEHTSFDQRVRYRTKGQAAYVARLLNEEAASDASNPRPTSREEPSMTATHTLIAQAQSAFPDEEIVDVLDACEAIYMNGFADETIGDVETIGHFYRVDRFIVSTDSQGFHTCHTCETVEEATEEMARLSALEDEDV